MVKVELFRSEHNVESMYSVKFIIVLQVMSRAQASMLDVLYLKVYIHPFTLMFTLVLRPE